MSVDPALRVVNIAPEFPDISELPIEERSVYIFDFDGVITTRTEDKIYKLSESPDEAELFEKIEKRLGVDFRGLDHRYRRHLLFQAAAWHVKLEIEKGRGFEKAIAAARGSSVFFILTARSGWYPVERLRAFVADNNLKPVDCYNVGRVSKDLQITMLAQEFEGSQLFYVDDSLSQCQIVDALALRNVEVFTCRESNSGTEPEQVYRDVMEEYLHLHDPPYDSYNVKAEMRNREEL